MIDFDSLIMFTILPILTLMVLPALVVAVLAVRDTVRRRGRWGINTRKVYCAECGAPAPLVRVPANWRQALWGGCTCTECGLEYDKWGQAVHQTTAPADDELDDGPRAPNQRT